MDEGVEVRGELSERDILTEVLNKKSVTLSDVEDKQDGAEDTTPVPTLLEALNYLHELRRQYIGGQTNVSQSDFNSLNKLEDFANLKRMNSTKQAHFKLFFLNCSLITPIQKV